MSETTDYRSGLMGLLRMSVKEHTAQVTTASMPVEGNTQGFGLLHGGATAALAETVASIAATEHARNLAKEGPIRVAVGTELSISHLRPARTGTVTATARAEHLGKTRTVHRVLVVDEDGKAVAAALVTNMLVEPRD